MRILTLLVLSLFLMAGTCGKDATQGTVAKPLCSTKVARDGAVTESCKWRDEEGLYCTSSSTYASRESHRAMKMGGSSSSSSDSSSMKSQSRSCQTGGFASG